MKARRSLGYSSSGPHLAAPEVEEKHGEEGREEERSAGEMRIAMGKMLPIVRVSAVVMAIQAVMAVVVYLLVPCQVEIDG